MTRMELQRRKRINRIIDTLIVIFIFVAMFLLIDVYIDVQHVFDRMESGAETAKVAEDTIANAKAVLAELEAQKVEWLKARVEGI